MATVVSIPGRLNNSNLGTRTQVASPNYTNDAQTTYMELKSKGTTNVKLFYSPKETNHSGLSAQWEEIVRAGQDPIIVNSGTLSERMSFECTLAAAQRRDIIAELQSLRKMAKSRDPVQVSYTDWEGAGYWRISSMTVDIVQRSSIDHAPTLAKVTLELMALPGSTSGTGMLTGGAAPTASGGTSEGMKFYVVKNGDTLWAIAQKFYGDGEKWTAIAKENYLSNTRGKAKLQAGQPGTLRIPGLTQVRDYG